MRNLGLKLRMGVAAGVILLTYAFIMNYLIAILFGGASLADPFWMVVLAGATAVAVGLTYLGGIASIISSSEDMLSSEDSPELSRRAQELADRMEIDRPDIGFERMGAPNAYAAGRRNNGYVVLSTELLETLTVDEVECIMAHEFAHLRNRDSIITTVGTTVTNITGWVVRGAGLLVGFVGYFILKLFRRWTGRPYYPGFPAHQQARIKLLADMVRDVITGFITIFIRTLSRQREYIADETAVRFTGNPAAMKSALRKVGDYSATGQRGTQQAEGADETTRTGVPDALCVHSEFSGAFEPLFKTHPSIDSRVSRLDTVYSSGSFDPDVAGDSQASPEDTGQRSGQSASGRASARGTVINGTTNGRALIRADIAADGVFHLSDIETDLSAGETVRLYYPASVRDPSASDITAVERVDGNGGSGMSTAPGIVDSATGTRIAVRSDVADGGVFYLSGVQADLSAGDRVRLYYPQTEPDPDASDIEAVRPAE